MSGAFPRVLIITPGALNPYRESGVTLLNLFEDWPSEALAQLHADPAVEGSTGPRGIRWYDLAAAGKGGTYHPLQRRARALLSFALGRSEHGLLWTRLSPRLRRWLEDVRPDVILSQTGNLAFLRLTRQVARALDVPVVLYAADDWVSDWPASNLGRRLPPVTDWLASTVRREFAALAREAAGHFTIGEAMAEEYERRYGMTWQALPNPIRIEEWPQRLPVARAYTQEAPFRILYSGSLHTMASYGAVQLLAEAVGMLAAAGEPVALEVATHPGFHFRRPELERWPGVTVRDLVPREEYRGRLSAVDLLVVPVVFNPLHLRYIRLSMPGKVSEYLASGTPILVFADASTAVAQHARDRGWGEVVDTSSAVALGDALLRLMRDPQRQAALSARAYEVARMEFDARAHAQRLETTLREATRRGGA